MKLGRNEKCHCGSGLKYKKCHMQEDEDLAYIEKNKDMADKICWRESDYAFDIFVCPYPHQMTVMYHEDVDPADIEDEIVCIHCAGPDYSGPKIPARRVHVKTRPVPTTMILPIKNRKTGEVEQIEGYISDPQFMWMPGKDGPELKFLNMEFPWRRLDEVEWLETFNGVKA